MSEPCPPAFMRTPPPTEPGTPTAHSNPVRPAATVRRASTGSATAAPALTTIDASAPRCRSTRCRSTGDQDRDAGEPLVGDQQVRAAADHQHRQVVACDAAATRLQIVDGCAGVTNSAAAPPTRYVVIGPSGTFARPAASKRIAEIDALGSARVDVHWSSRSDPIVAAQRPSRSRAAPRRATRRCRHSPSRCRRRRRAALRRRSRSDRRAVASTPTASCGCASSTALTTSLPVTPGMGVGAARRRCRSARRHRRRRTRRGTRAT